MTYISKLAKNGKMQYFRIGEDGKKKMVKRGEYEANVPADGQGQLGIEFHEVEIATVPTASAEPEYAAEPIPERPASIEVPAVPNPFDFVKAAVESVTGRYKLTYKEWKKYGSTTLFRRTGRACMAGWIAAMSPARPYPPHSSRTRCE